MKRVTLIAVIIMAMLSCNNQTSNKVNAQSTSSNKDKKILIVYYSWSSGENTRNMAEQIKETTGADIFEIVPVKAYPTEYRECVDQAKVEIDSKFKPEIKGKVENFDSYDIIFIGSPNW
jgi:flavodoxin